ncbi:MAG: ankyrin repeat domain-containing protein [Verrucomicrobiota bacterium]
MRTSTIRTLIGGTTATLLIIRATTFLPDSEAQLPLPPRAPVALLEKQEPAAGWQGMFLPVMAERHAAVIQHCFGTEFTPRPPRSPSEMLLVAAALKRDWEMVRRLLKAGAPVEAADDEGVTPLMAAAMQGDVTQLRALLEQHARIDLLDVNGRSALHHAIAAGKLEAIDLLLPLATNLEALSAGGRDLLTTAFDAGNAAIFQMILERSPATLQWTASTLHALDIAISAGLRDQVRLLLSKHLAPPTRESGSVPLIAYAMAEGNTTAFETLLACGSDPNLVLPQAAEKEFMSLVKSKYLRLYIQEETGVNLLMLAAGLGKTAYVRALLDAGADRNRMTPREKMLPLYFAAWNADWKCVQLLLGGGPLPERLRIEISLAKQNAAVIKDGVAVFTTECSTGREGFSTRPGHYVITDKDRDHRSTIYKVAMPYFMRLSCRDFGMHEGAVPRYPASHGCIRLPSGAARRLFTEIPVGTVVVVN